MRTLNAILVPAVTIVLSVAGCRDITTLDQSNPGAIEVDKLYVPANAPLLVNGAIGDFECAYSRYVVGSGLLADELSNAIASSDNYDYDGRRLRTSQAYGTANCGNNQQPPIYAPLSIARASADSTLARLKGWTQAELPTTLNRERSIAQMYAYAGYSLLLLGEGMCTAALNLGPEMMPADLFAEAKMRFDSAIVYAAAVAPNTAADVTLGNFARLGRARTFLNLADYTNAAADATLIPAAFPGVSTSNDAVNSRRQNTVFTSINQNSWATVDPSFRNLTIGAIADPRVAVTDLNRNGTAPGTRVWAANKHAALATTMVISKYAEAQLILAETNARAGNLTAAETAINNARNTRGGMPQYSATGQTQQQVLDQIVEERRREFFLEGHRLQDFRRFNLPLSPAVGALDAGNQAYGDQRCFQLPDVERVNNPNL
jgi:starch-binding outer membrane protein, SusD/RagB family